MFTCEIREDITLAELLELLRGGFDVTKSPHVGNWYTNNLLCAELGFNFTVVDRNIGHRDTIFHPDHIIVGGKKYMTSQSSVLSFAGTVTRVPDEARNFAELGENVAAMHMRHIKRLYPNIRTLTCQELFAVHQDWILPLVVNLASRFPHHFYRAVNADGRAVPVSLSHHHAHTTEFAGLSPGASLRGVLVPNKILILLDALRAVKNSGKTLVYTLSGPSMYQYIGGIYDELQEIYQSMTEYLPWAPKSLQMIMVPVANCRFAAPLSKAEELNALVRLYQSQSKAEEAMKQRIAECARQNGQESANALGPEKNLMLHYHDLAYATHMRGLMREVFYDVTKGDFYSHYDQLRDGECLYIHRVNLDMPIVDINRMYSRLTNLTKLSFAPRT